MQRRFLLAATVLAVACGSSAVTGDGAVATSSSALTAAQCSYFTASGKVQICHYTGAAKKPYNLLQVDTTNCITGHTGHPKDFVSLTGDCNELGCLPDGAPFDANAVDTNSPTPPCCPGLSPVDGVCKARCEDVTCPPVADPSCYFRACNTGTGVCETSLIGGRDCGNECSTDADCTVLVDGHPDPCLFKSGTCVPSGAAFVCSYAPTDCDDGNACTTDWCESGVGCHHIPITGCAP